MTTILNQTRIRAMQGLADEIIKKRTSEIKNEVNDDLAKSIKEQVKVAFEKEGAKPLEVYYVGKYICNQIRQYYYDHILNPQIIYDNF